MTLRSAISTPQGKQRYVRQLFSTIADRYDVITVALSYGQDRRWKRRLIALAGIEGRDSVLDLACGTGDLLFAAAPHARVAVGLDLTHRMLQLARLRSGFGEASPLRQGFGAATTHHPPSTTHHLIQGDMIALPFASGRFTVVTTGYGLRNVPDLPRAIAEIHRVLAPGGRLLSLDFNKPAHAIVLAIYLGYLTVVGSALGLLLHGDPDTYRYIPESIRLYPGAEGVVRLLEDGGFSAVRALPVLGGLMAIHIARKM